MVENSFNPAYNNRIRSHTVKHINSQYNVGKDDDI